MNERIKNKQISDKPRFHSLRMNSLGQRMRAELRTSFKEKREGVKIRRDGKGAHLGEQKESIERRGEESVSTNDDIVTKG